MRFTDGPTMHGQITYLELQQPHRMVYVQHFCDEQERIIRPSFFPAWPLAMHTPPVELASEGPDRTRRGHWRPAEAEAGTSPSSSASAAA